MTTPTAQQTAVAAAAAHWDVGGYRIWESTEPGVLLYARHELRLATDSAGRPLAALTRTLAWNGAAYEPTGGAATLGFLGEESDDAARVLSMQDAWTRVIRAGGYSGAGSEADPRYLPLPIQGAALSAQLDPAEAAVAGTPTGTILRVDLTAAGAAAWAATITDGAPVAGTLGLSYQYPRLMLPATAIVRVHGRLVYAGLAARLIAASDGELSGTMAQIRIAWTELARTGAIEVSLTGSPAGTLADSRDDLVEQVRENLVDSMFVATAAATTGPPVFALRWKRAADVPDLPLTVSVEGGWTWLTETLEASVAEILSGLDPSAINDVHPSVSVAVQVTVDPCEHVESVSVSLDFGDIRAPEALTFDSAGGTRTFTVTTEHPDLLVVRQRTRINFRTLSWPVCTAEGTLTAAAPVLRINPDGWLRRREIYLFFLKNREIISDAWDENDVLTVTVRYENPALPAPITSSSAIQAGPVTITYPVPPGAPPGRCTITVLGSVGGRLVQGSGELGSADEAAYFLLEDGALRFLTGSSQLPESDAVGQRLRASRGRPLVRHEIPPEAETDRRLAVALDVTLVPQPTTVSGWAAALAMVAGARDHVSVTPATVAGRAGMDLEKSYAWPQIREAVTACGLVEQGSPSSPPGELAGLLRETGPIWVVDIAAPYHGVVVGGITGDGSRDGTWVRLYNPWPPGVGSIDQVTFTEFYQEFGLGPGSGTAMVHG